MKNILPAILLGLLILQGCKDSNNLDDQTASVLGVWKLNSSMGDDQHIDISADSVTSYDYMGDSYDEGPDCYEITSEQILGIDGNKYTFADPFDPGSTYIVELTRKDNQLTARHNFGDVAITLSFTKSNASVGSFVPACTEVTAKARKHRSIFN